MFPLPEFPSETVGLWKMLHCCQQSLSTPPKPSWSLLDFSPCTNAGTCLKTGTDCENCNPPVISKVKNTCSQIDLHLTFGYLNLFFSKIQMTFHSAQKAHNMSSFDNVAESHVSGAGVSGRWWNYKYQINAFNEMYIFSSLMFDVVSTSLISDHHHPSSKERGSFFCQCLKSSQTISWVQLCGISAS